MDPSLLFTVYAVFTFTGESERIVLAAKTVICEQLIAVLCSRNVVNPRLFRAFYLPCLQRERRLAF